MNATNVNKESNSSQDRTPRPARAPLVALLLLLAGAGCGSIGSGFREPERGPTLGRVVAKLPDPVHDTAPRPAPDRTEVLAAYAAIEGRVTEPTLKQAIGRRVADLTMGVAEDRDAAGEPHPYDEAIERYTALLDDTAGAERAQVLYQLARAQDMAGQTERAAESLDRLIADHADQGLVVEARFRRAEMAFSAERWRAAEDDYAYVVDAGAGSTWWLNAVYMSGWARFKDGDPEGALDRFLKVLDTLQGPTTAGSDHQELHTDTLRVTTLALDYLDGPQTLATRMRSAGLPAWQYAVYQALAESYLARQRYLDSVATWQTFIDEQPLDARAPGAQRNAIDILRAADFPTETREGQARFVAAYGIDSAFWAAHPDSVRDTYLATLKVYLDELARTSHAAAQRSGEAEVYAAAARWYEESIRTFADDPDTARQLFLLGELHAEARNTAQAVAAYQRVVRDYPGYPDAAEAGYAAILGLDSLAANAAADDRERRTRDRIEAQVEFATRFPADPRTPAVSAAAADGLYGLGDHGAALTQAETLLAAHPGLDPALRTTALAVVGHSRFELDEFAAAELAYRELLASTSAPAQHAEVTERLQAAIYRQAEASERQGETDSAIAHYLRVGELAADSELAIQARFDAIAVLETSGRTLEAARQLEAFQRRHADHPLAADAPRRLANLWEQTGDRQLAGAAWLEVSASDADPEIRRQALYRAAELALEAGDGGAAATHFTAYAGQYPRPADLRMEALDHLDRLADASGDLPQRRQWLVAKVELERQMRAEGAAESALARARQLAAAAQFDLAREARSRFDALQIVNPLAESLERKQQALLDALAAFEATAGYEVAEYLTASTWQIGDLYAALARALMESERPQGLSAEALAEYDLLLEEQAFPFEEQAIALHEINVRRSWVGQWDPWIERSFEALRGLVPARFDRPEAEVAGARPAAPATCATARNARWNCAARAISRPPSDSTSPASPRSPTIGRRI
jgi:cellulose synthase operon protein C